MKLNQTEIVFKDSRYGDNTIVKLEIENEGDGLLDFEIFRLLDRTNIRNVGWLTITPLRGVIKGGEKKEI
jgi:hypothetical protein